MSSTIVRTHGVRHGRVARRRMTLLGIATILSLLVSLFPQIVGQPMPTASAHNLQTKMVYMFFDEATQTLLDTRIAGGWMPGEPILDPGDQVGLIIKVVPRDGTTTGVGGHIDFYVPSGVTVTDVAYMVPDGSGGFVPAAMKGQSPIAIGDGPIGAKATTQLIGMSSRGPNVNGVTENPVVPTSGLHRGTIAGVYGDTGIFYATDPDTAYGSWQRFTGDWNYSNSFANHCGLTSSLPAPNGKSITNNSGDVFVPCNKWDAEQMYAWGVKGTTYTGSGAASTPIVDYGDGRGNAPWGFASGVAGPDSGYAWFFDWDEWRISAKTAADMQAAMDTKGPWERIKYNGSRISYDQPGLVSTLLGYASIDGGWLGDDLTAGDLPATVSQTDTTSPKVIRWTVGQLTAYRPEYVWVKFRVDQPNGSFLDPSGCPVFHSDTFGGDAGGTDNGKDHLWRYYEPSEYTWNGCMAVGKQGTAEFVQVGQTFSYDLRVYNLGVTTQTNVVIKDTLPGGVAFLSAVPAQNSGPNPLIWNVGALQPNQYFQATLNVKATATGYLDNCVTVISDQGTQNSCETTVSGSYPYLVPTKSVTPTSTAPGGSVTYTMLVKNVGSGPTGSPVTVTDYLPSYFTYQSLGPVYVNGALVTGVTVNAANPSQPVFTVPVALQAGKELKITFIATVTAGTPPATYCNTYTVTQNGVPVTTGTQACVNVGGGQIGDTLWRDWDGDGTQDAGEEGLAGVTVNLYASDGTTLLGTATTDANGHYLFTGLTEGTYVVKVNGGTTPAGYTQTYDPDGTVNNAHTVTLTTNQQYLAADFGYMPTGTASIGDLVFEDKGNDGSYDSGLGDLPIAGITVNLYEDTNGNGVIDPGVDALVATDVTDANGIYGFSNLATGYDYIVDVVDAGIDAYFGTTSDGWDLTTAADPYPVDNLSGAYTTADFGFYKLVPGAIGDQVFVDVNGNGTYEAGTDQPLADITVSLYRDTNANGVLDAGEPLLQTDSSDSLGVYGFENIPAGDYIVVVDSADPDVPAGLFPVTSQYATNLSSGETDYTLDFPFAQLLQKSVTPTTAQPGDVLTYTLNVNYTGATALENVVVTDTIPSGVTYVGGSANAGGYLSVDGKTVIWNLGSGEPGHPGVTAPTGTALCYGAKTYDTTTLVQDTYVRQDQATTNNGAATVIQTHPETSKYQHSLLYFDLAADPPPANAQLIKAELKLTVTTARAGHTDNLYRMTTPWTEAGATWDDSDGAGAGDWAAGTFGAGDYNATLLGSVIPSTTGTKVVNVTNTVKDWAFNGVPNRGFALISTGTDRNDIKYGSSENTTATSRPALVVSYYYQSSTTCSATVDLASVADTYIQKDAQTTTAGTATTMWTNPSVNDTGTDTNHSLVKFDLTPIPPGATITAATLKIRVVNDRDADHEVAIHRMITPWTEAGASWGDANGATAGDWASGIFGTGDYSTSLGSFFAINQQLYTVDVGPAVVNNWVNNGVANNGFLLRATNTDNGDAKHGTRENTTATNRPVLTVSWSATPNTNPQTTTTLKAEPLYRNGAGQVKVTMTAAVASGSITGVTPPASLTVNASGATVTLASGPTPAGPVTITSTSPAAFVYVYNVTPGTLPGTVRWTGSPTLPAGNFAIAASETIITAPPLSFRATVNAGTTLGAIKNSAAFTARETGAKLAPDMCTVVADGNPDTTTVDQIVFMDPSTGDYSEPVGGATSTGTYNVESLAWSPDGTKLYAVEAGSLVTLDPATGANTIVGPIGAIQGALGTIWTPDVDSLAFDPATGILYAVGRQEDSPITAGNTLVDVLFQINPATGLRVANAYGTGLDYIPISTQTLTTPLYDVDGIAFDPQAGTLYAIANDPTANIGLGDRLVTINKATGAVTDVGRLTSAADGTTAITDMEGLSFLPEFGLIGSTGDASTDTTQRSLLWLIQSTAVGGLVMSDRVTPVPASIYVDWEAVACKAGPVELGDFIVEGAGSNEAVTALKASIGDRVWADLDGAGDQDAGEPGLAGVVVKLYDSTGTTLLATTTTDATGAYHFWDLNAGTYKVTYDLASAPAGYQPTTASTLTATVTTGQQYTAADFGLEPPGTASIGDTVWLDADEDGVVDATESGLPGVTVKLYHDLNNNGVLDTSDPLVDTATTDADGKYLFTDLQDSKYLVQVDTTSPVTSPYDGTTTLAAAMDLVSGVNPRPVTLAEGQVYDMADFGFNWKGAIGDFVWYDNNISGTYEPSQGETPIQGAIVLLYFDVNGNGILDPAYGDYQIGFAMTDANGAYHFNNLPPGDYLVDVYEDSITTDGVRDIVPTTDDVQYKSLAAGEVYDGADFGYYLGARVEGNVFWDADHNGVFDGGETGLTPVTVTLTGTDMFGNPVSATVDTDASGHFTFLVPEGNYTLTYDALDVLAIDPSLGAPTTPTSLSFHAYPGEDWQQTFDFGVDNNGAIGDLVWNDADGDGVPDAGEPGIGGATVTLYWDTDNNGIYSPGDKFFGATATDPSGAYLFTGLGDGNYVVVVDPATLPAGYTQTGDPEANNDNQGAAAVSGGGSVLTMDFGYTPPASAHDVSGVIWNDNGGGGGGAGNGVQDGAEPGLPNVTVCLYDSAGVTSLACTTTDANGNYTFPGVADGTYVVKVDPTTLPSPAYDQTGDPDPILDNQTTVTVSGADVGGESFGYQEVLGSISGTVCDGDGDGLCETGETGLTPVTVTLIYAGPDGILGTTDDVSTPTTTDANGDYSFPNLVPGAYQIIETNPLNYTSLADADGGNPDNISLVLPLGENKVDQDFEDLRVENGFIGDLVWWDVDKDGEQDAGEPGIAGVTVELLKNSSVIATTTTDASGLYQFTGLSDGAYTVRIQGAEFTSTGTLYHWLGSPQDAAGVPDNLDSDGNPTTHVAAVTLTGSVGTADTDFGFHITASYTVAKQLVSAYPARLGEEVRFTITIQNTGYSWISVLPLQDSYSNAFLTYGFGSQFATPNTDDNINDGMLDWSDLTAASPYGFGADLAPGETRIVLISFTARSDTGALPNDETVNTVTSANAVADPDGPNGPLPPLAPLTAVESSDGVAIYTPTGVIFEWFDAVTEGDGVLVNWRTASETGIIGFNVLRMAEGGAFEVVNSEFIPAAYAGQDAGSVYTFKDGGLAPGAYDYALQFVRLDGSIEGYGLVRVNFHP